MPWNLEPVELDFFENAPYRFVLTETVHHPAQTVFRAIACDPQNTKAFFYRGTVKEALEDHEAAISDFSKSLELVPYQFEPLLGRAMSRGRLGQWDQALEDCDAALDLIPDDKQALEVRHQLVQRRGPMEKKPVG